MPGGSSTEDLIHPVAAPDPSYGTVQKHNVPIVLQLEGWGTGGNAHTTPPQEKISAIIRQQ